MRRLSQFVSAGAIAAGLSVPAVAADLAYPMRPPLASSHGAEVAELGTGWYLRGDIGYVEYAKPREALGYSKGLPFDTVTLDNAWSAGGGIGYAFTNWLRADVTVDHRFDSNAKGVSSGSNYVHGFSTDALKLESTTALFNGYVDLGTWSGVTPYIGAGIGFARNNFHDYYTQVTCITDLCRANFSEARLTMPAGNKNNLAWAVMAGAAVDIAAGFKLDLGYRYVRIGDAKTELDIDGYGFKVKPLDAHEFRVGFRYMIDSSF